MHEEFFKSFATAIVIVEYPNLGFLPILAVGSKEVYRGEYQPTPEAAFQKAMAAVKIVESQMPSNSKLGC